MICAPHTRLASHESAAHNLRLRAKSTRNSTDPIVCERSSDVRFGEPIGSERAR